MATYRLTRRGEVAVAYAKATAAALVFLAFLALGTALVAAWFHAL